MFDGFELLLMPVPLVVQVPKPLLAPRWLDGALKNWSRETAVPQNRVLLTEAESEGCVACVQI